MSIRHSFSMYWVISTLILTFVSSLTYADELEKRRWFSITLDNDIFVGTDGGYTNGLYASWFYIPDRPQTENELPWYFRLQSRLTYISNTAQQVHIHNISQTMVTPNDIKRVPPDPNDSPYAGLLFWQGSILSVEKRITDLSSLLFGVLGPASLAGQSQKIVHKATGSEIPKGWSYQLRNEALIGINYGRFIRVYSDSVGSVEFDTVVGANGFLGNLITAIESVGYIRIGKRLESSYPMFALASNREINPTAYAGGWFAYVGAGVLYTFHDLLLDRHSVGNSPTSLSDNYAESLSVGAAISGVRWGFSISYSEAGFLGINTSEPLRFGSLTFLRKLK